MGRVPWWLWALAGLVLLALAGGGAVLAMHLIKRWEGLRLEVYQDVAGFWTVGYGHLITQADNLYPYSYVTEITEAEADRLLAQDLRIAQGIVAQHVRVPLTPAQRDALVSFVFNIGAGVPSERDGFVYLKNGQPSTMLRKINAGDFEGAAAEFDKWNRAAGRVSNGLVARRADERALFEVV